MSDEGTATVPLETEPVDPTRPQPAPRKPFGENHIGTGTPPPSAPTEDGHHSRKPLTNHIGTGTPAPLTDSATGDEGGETDPPPPPPAPDNHIGTGVPPADEPPSDK